MTAQVETMVRRFIAMPGTLVLHVVKADQDYDSVLGNDFLRRQDHDDRVTDTDCPHPLR